MTLVMSSSLSYHDMIHFIYLDDFYNVENIESFYKTEIFVAKNDAGKPFPADVIYINGIYANIMEKNE